MMQGRRPRRQGRPEHPGRTLEAGFRFAHPRQQRPIAWLAVLAALSAATAFAVLGYAAGLLPDGRVPETLFIVALVAIVASIYLRDAVQMATTRLIETANLRYRRTILRLLAGLDLRSVETVGPANLYFNIASNPRKLSETTSLIGRIVTLVARLLCSLVVMVLLAPLAAVATLFLLVVLGVSFVFTTPPALAAEDAAEKAEARFFSGIEALVHGFKAIKLNQPLAQDFMQTALTSPALAAQENKTRAGRWLSLNFVLSTVAKLIGAAGVLVLVPWIGHAGQAEPALIAAVTVIALLPITVLQQAPVVLRAGTALKSLKGFLDRLVQLQPTVPIPAAPAAVRPATVTTDGDAVGPFRSLEAHALEYRFTDQQGRTTGFRVGPLDFRIDGGSLTFIVGGNGSGKTTLLKLLTGLYRPTDGTIRFNGLDADTASDLRNRYCSSVFSDPFLFRRLYGLGAIDPDRVNVMLALLQIDHVTEYGPAGFTNLSLSTGQRKRLALAAALLEDRPVLFLDEFAADQDPDFRRRFYAELLPRFRADGRTVIAVTHDDAYFTAADRLLHMREGRLMDG